MAYKHFSNTSSGWEISTDPTADPDRLWRAVHPQFGERFFDAHHKILEYTVQHMLRQFEKQADHPGKIRSWTAALCLHCGGQWMVPGNPDPRTLEGVCMGCQADSNSDTEKPLLFTYIVTASPDLRPNLPELPKEWLA